MRQRPQMVAVLQAAADFDDLSVERVDAALPKQQLAKLQTSAHRGRPFGDPARNGDTHLFLAPARGQLKMSVPFPSPNCATTSEIPAATNALCSGAAAGGA